MDALEEQPIQSILAVDCGSLHTRALLMDIVADEYRFVGSGVAPTTTEAPYQDITVGVYNAIVDLESTTGRHLVEGGRVVTPQHPDGHGVDVFVATCSAMPAVRLVVAGLTNEYSTRAARQAAAGAYTHLLETISFDDPVAQPGPGALTRKGPTRNSAWADTQLNKLLALAPDVLLMTGGSEGGPIAPLLHIARVVVRMVTEQRQREQQAALVGGTVAPPPLLFFAGNSAALDRVQATLGDAASVVTLPNIQPVLGTFQPEPVRDALVNLVRQKQMPALAGMDALRTWSRREIEPTVHAVELVTRYISIQYHREVLTADVGAANTAISVSGGKDGTTHGTAVRGDFGLAQGISNLLAEVGPEAILRWLPFESSAEEVNDWALNRVIRPWTVAQSPRDLAIEHAFAREALRSALSDLRSGRDLPTATYDLLIGTGGLLANAPRVGQAALILLDALEPTGEGVGSLEIALDSTLMMPALGALAPVHPAAAAYLFDRDCLVLLGTCVVPLGTPGGGLLAPAPPKNGRRAARPAAPTDGAAPALAPAGSRGPIAVEVTVDYAEAGSITIEVPYGSIEVIPLRPEQRASLRVKPAAGFRIGTDEPGKQVQTKPGEEIKGGLIGLIIDARGRPLTLPSDPQARIAKLLEWGQAIRAYSGRESFSLLPEPVVAPPIPAAEAEAPVGPGGFVSRFGPAAGRISFGEPLGGEVGAALAPPPEPEQPQGLEPAPAPPAQEPRLGTGPLARPGTGPLTPPGARPGTGPLGEGAPRRTGSTGKLNLPSRGGGSSGRTGTAPLQWPKDKEE
ncbi:MAG TPA: glutamate mutase L [Chloroflexia bacterium]|nr:glutamate mutase L [Chloroflexia bacterium]